MGYTMLVGNDTKTPVSAMLVESYTHTRKAQAEAPADGFGRNNNDELQQASMFIAGSIRDHLGVSYQFTNEESSGNLGGDNIAMRYAGTQPERRLLGRARGGTRRIRLRRMDD